MIVSDQRTSHLHTDKPHRGINLFNDTKKILNNILLLPLELLIEIIAHLALPDILTLCRTNKLLRRMLMTRTVATLDLWRMAIQNIPGLPQCPKELTEPQYAALIYSQHCMVCGTGTTEPMDPYLNARMCQKCIEVHVVDVEEIKPESIRALVPQSAATTPRACRYLTKTCLLRDKESAEAWHGELYKRQLTRQEIRVEISQMTDSILERLRYGKEMTQFLRMSRV
ncbi:hypothetical protein RSOLAG1IB_06765 [Rhizoctonia solani AG-1 IB]|uniref:F-box domain-containing protein n=1 Tax=Thanatephorus cucumeris (strain AG1-IB / isolate 7/3/14) TaxID=1108050 RepID=A0A0B7F7P8_THACB|nr:hypothetical protein RSOLAG1IB_06765 [Rhizoctonia solani AG-1 IB]